jgi:hypothetical protein
MEMQIIAIYCLLDDYIKSIGHQDWPNARLTTAEVMLINVVGMRFFYGNVETARRFLIDHRYIHNMLTKSALNRRTHQIPSEWWEQILEFIQRLKNGGILPQEYIVDAFPVSFAGILGFEIAGSIKEKNSEGITLAKENTSMG